MGAADVVTLVRAALPAVPGINQLPGIRKQGGPFTTISREAGAVRVERRHVDAYAEVCGFPRKDTVPMTYPHVLAFPLHMAAMGDPRFPWAAVGMVHTENSITAHRPVRVGEAIDVAVAVGAPRAHDKGALVDFRTVVSAAGEVVWESTSTYLRQGRTVGGEPSPGKSLPPAPVGALSWHLGADLGRRYAAVSGDHNPIHLYPWTARALGFPRQIAHGMWSLARCVAALENRLPPSARVDVAFKKPILLPATVVLGHDVTAEGHVFGLTRPGDGAPHLVGRVTAT